MFKIRAPLVTKQWVLVARAEAQLGLPKDGSPLSIYSNDRHGACLSACLSLQLFTKPHPARTAAGKPSPGKDVSTPASLPGHPQPFLYSLQSLRPSQVTVKGELLVLLWVVSCPGAVPQ